MTCHAKARVGVGGFFHLVMAIEAYVIVAFHEDPWIVRRVGVMTGQTAHLHRGMHRFLREFGLVMAAIAKLGLLRRKAFGKRGGLCMRDLKSIGDAGMAGRAAHRDRGVHDLHPDGEAGIAFVAVDLHRRSRAAAGAAAVAAATAMQMDSETMPASWSDNKYLISMQNLRGWR